MEDRFYRPRDAYALCAVSESFARRDPSFPRPLVLSRTRSGRPARVVFLGSELEKWRAARIAHARGASHAAPAPEAA